MDFTLSKKAICGGCHNQMTETEKEGVIKLECLECGRTVYIK
jgi:predicted  nucleic acid-binding Zn-ribbon protein